MGKAGGARQGSGSGKSGYYKGVYCASTYELAWVIYHIDHNLKFERAKEVFKYNGTRKYFPDFKYPDTCHFIEIKGFVRQDEDIEQKLQSVRDAGFTISILFQDDLSGCFKWVKEHYKYTQLQELYDGHKPKFWFTCKHCLNGFGSFYTPRFYCSNICAGKAARGRNKKKLDENSYYLRSPEMKEKMSKIMKKCHQENPRAWVTNGIVSVMVFKKELGIMFSLGFVRGKKFGTPIETRTRFIGVKAR
jgi:hypothetical protein